MEQNRRITRLSTGHILDPQDFLRVAIDKGLAQELLNGLERSGLLRVCSYKFKGFYHNISLEFFEHARVEENVILSTVNGVHVEVNVSDIRELFGFSVNDLPFEDHAFEFDEFWKIVRKNENDERPKFSGFKHFLKWEFENLADVIQRCVYNLFGSIEKLSVKYARGLHAVYYGVKLDWSKTIFDRLITFVRDGGHVGYGFMVSELLRMKGIRLGACRSVTNYNYVLRKEKKRKAKLMSEMQQGEGSTQASIRRRTNIVCEDLNIPVPESGGRILDIVVHGEKNRARLEEQGTTLDQIFESVGLNTPRGGHDQENLGTNIESTTEGITGEEIQTLLQEGQLTGFENVGLPCVEAVVEEVVEPVEEPVGEPVVEPLVEPVEEANVEPLHENLEEQTANNNTTATATATANLENNLAQHFEDFQNSFDELKNIMDNSQHSFGEKLQVLNDKFTILEKKVARVNPALREEINALKIELNVAIQKEKAHLAESLKAQKDEVNQHMNRLRAMNTHQMEQLERVKNTMVEKEIAHNAEMQKLREEVAIVYGTCDSMATLLQNVYKELKEIKDQQVENTSITREIRMQQKGDAHFFPRILDAAKTGGRGGNQFGQIGGTSSQGEGERVTTSFKSFSNPTGNVFSTFSAPKVTSQPEAPGLTEQEHEDRMVDIFATYLNVAHDAIIDKDGRNARECAKWYLRNVFPANDIRDAVECYKKGRVFQQFYHSDDKGDFKKLRKRINDMLGI